MFGQTCIVSLGEVYGQSPRVQQDVGWFLPTKRGVDIFQGREFCVPDLLGRFYDFLHSLLVSCRAVVEQHQNLLSQNSLSDARGGHQ